MKSSRRRFHLGVESSEERGFPPFSKNQLLKPMGLWLIFGRKMANRREKNCHFSLSVPLPQSHFSSKHTHTPLKGSYTHWVILWQHLGLLWPVLLNVKTLIPYHLWACFDKLEWNGLLTERDYTAENCILVYDFGIPPPTVHLDNINSSLNRFRRRLILQRNS